jgi:hypothetical protein
MAIPWRKVLELLPRFALSALPGIVSAGRMSQVLNTAAGKKLKGATFTYPSMTSDFYYPMVRDVKTTMVNGRKTNLPALNFGIDRENQSAALAQDLGKHNIAVANGDEDKLEQWWPGKDVRPRRVINPTSSAIEGIRINKDGTVQVKWIKGSTWYKYKAGRDIRESSEMAKDLLTSPSIGRALVRKGKLAHKDSKDLTGNPVPDPNVGWWGRKYYNPNY